jgi:hypothetical protein
VAKLIPSPDLIEVPDFRAYAAERGLTSLASNTHPRYDDFEGLPDGGYAYFKVARNSRLHTLLEAIVSWSEDIRDERIRIRDLFKAKALVSTGERIKGLVYQLPKFRKQKKSEVATAYSTERNFFLEARRKELANRFCPRTWTVSTGIDCLDLKEGRYGVSVYPTMDRGEGKKAAAMLGRLHLFTPADLLVLWGVISPTAAVDSTVTAKTIRTARFTCLKERDSFVVLVPTTAGQEHRAKLLCKGARRIFWSEYVKLLEDDARLAKSK